MTDLPSQPSQDESLEHNTVQFIFRFTVFEVVAQVFNRQMVIKFGLKTSVIQLDAIRYLYFRDLKDQKMSEITVAVSRGDKLRRVRIYADIKEDRFLDLWNYLKQHNSDADISGLPIAEAYRIMGSKNNPWLAISSVMSIGVLLVAVLSSPLLFHGLDQGLTQLDLEHVYHHTANHDQSPPSRNVRFQGWIDLEHAWRLRETQGGYTDLKIVAPIYPLSIKKERGDLPPARFVVSARNDQALHLAEHPENMIREGILRTIWWEGLGSLAYQKLKKSGVDVSPKVELIEVGEIKQKRRDDLIMYLTSVGVLSLITLIITLYLKPSKYSTVS